MKETGNNVKVHIIHFHIFYPRTLLPYMSREDELAVPIKTQKQKNEKNCEVLTNIDEEIELEKMQVQVTACVIPLGSSSNRI